MRSEPGEISGRRKPEGLVADEITGHMCMGWGLSRRKDEFKGPQWAGYQKVGPQGGGLGWRGGFRRP